MFKIDYIESLKAIFTYAFEFAFGLFKLLLTFFWIALKDGWQFLLIVFAIYIVLRYLERKTEEIKRSKK
jgi:hypothetical protein